jgi:hypothetical protein
MQRLRIGVAALAIVLWVGAALAQDRAKGERRPTHTGTVVSVSGNKLVMRDRGKEGKEHTHTLAANAKVSCDGKECKLEDLKPGQGVRVTHQKDDPCVATRVEALDKEKNFERRAASKEGSKSRDKNNPK